MLVFVVFPSYIVLHARVTISSHSCGMQVNVPGGSPWYPVRSLEYRNWPYFLVVECCFYCRWPCALTDESSFGELSSVLERSLRCGIVSSFVQFDVLQQGGYGE